MGENKFHLGSFCVISIILALIISINLHHLSQTYGLLTNANATKQIVQNQSTMMNSITNKNMTDERLNVFNKSRQNDENSRMSTPELGPPSNGVSTNIQRYIDQLSNSTSSEIASFPINDLPSETTMSILKGLSIQNLYKVLTSISTDDLSTLLQRLPPDQINQILDKLPANQKTDVQSRVAS